MRHLNWFFGLAIGILALTTLHWRTEYQKSSAQNDRLRTALKMEKEFKQNVQSAIDSQTIAGLYKFRDSNVNNQGYQTLDLRSDGSGTFD